jgi:putative transposase
MQPGNIIHLYNHANGFENLFREDEDYLLFTHKLVKFASIVAEFHSYCQMPNHFHLLIRVKHEMEVCKSCLRGTPEKQAIRAFSNAFSSYTQFFNKKYGRMGGLFIPNMKQRLVHSEIDFCKVVHYIHSNPVHHGFTKRMDEWRYSSYSYYMQGRKGWLDTTYTIENFGSLDSFRKYHDQPIGLKSAIL